MKRDRSSPLRHGGRTRDRVALTFDDGPGQQSGAILDVLAAEGARATFFPIGNQLGRDAPLVRRTAAEGHELGNHSWNHRGKSRGTASALVDLLRSSLAIRRFAGAYPRVFRPPYGELSPELVRAARLARLRIVTWDVDARDWERADPETIEDRVLSQAWSGSIVVMHDGGGRRDRTAHALTAIVGGLRARGLELVTVSDLLRDGLD